MGLIARVLSFVRVTRNGAKITDVKASPGGRPNVTAEHFASPGDDSYPLPTDYAYLAPAPRKGRQAALGYVDPLNTPKAGQGDKRIYARDGAGTVVAEAWLKNTGEVLLDNDNGSMTLSPDGSITLLNGAGSVTLSAAGAILGQNGAGSFELQAGGNFVVNGVTITPVGLITVPDTPVAGIATPSILINGVEGKDHTHTQGIDSSGDTQQNTGPMA